MSERSVVRALERLAARNGVLAPERGGASFGVIANGDRRRRPLIRLTAAEVRDLASEGALSAAGDGGYVLTDAGRARVARERAAPMEAFAAQHRPILDRPVIDAEGDVRLARGHDADQLLRRLAVLRDGAGRAWLTPVELAAAARLRGDWERGEIGLVRGSDWSAAPKSSGPRGACADAAMAARCDTRRSVSDALGRLAPPLRAVLERVVLREEGIEALERAEKWPTRSGKLALKLALAQLAANYCA